MRACPYNSFRLTMTEPTTTTQKQQTRRRLIESSATLCKEKGFEATGVDALARSAGLTSGAFYRHFPGKASLLPEIVMLEFERTHQSLNKVVDGGVEALRDKINAYLSMDHVQAPGQGCMIPALGAEIGRADDDARHAYEQGVQTAVQQLSQLLPSTSRAWVHLCLAAGAIMVARGLVTPALQTELLAAAKEELFTDLYPPATQP